MRKELIYIVYANSQFRETSGGISALYTLARRLKEMGHVVKIWPGGKPASYIDWSFLSEISRQALNRRWWSVRQMIWYWRTQPPFGLQYASRNDLKNAVVIYAETIANNPLRAEHVVRWLLYKPGSLSEIPIDYGKDDLYFHYASAYLTEDTAAKSTKLSLSLMYTQYYRENVNAHREGCVYFIRKGLWVREGLRRNDIDIPEDGIVLDNASHAEIAAHFNRVKYVVSYDSHTAYLYYACICGCIPVVIPQEGLSREEWIRQTNHKYGIAYGFDDVRRAISTRQNLLRKLRDDVSIETYEIERFVEITRSAFARPS